MLVGCYAAVMAASLVIMTPGAAIAQDGHSPASGSARAAPAMPEETPPSTSAPDGAMTVEQAHAAAVAMMSRLDVNHDGRVSRIEMMAAISRENGRTLNLKRWKDADSDHDGFMSLGELADSIRKVSILQARDRAEHPGRPVPVPPPQVR